MHNYIWHENQGGIWEFRCITHTWKLQFRKAEFAHDPDKMCSRNFKCQFLIKEENLWLYFSTVTWNKHSVLKGQQECMCILRKIQMQPDTKITCKSCGSMCRNVRFRKSCTNTRWAVLWDINQRNVTACLIKPSMTWHWNDKLSNNSFLKLLMSLNFQTSKDV